MKFSTLKLLKLYLSIFNVKIYTFQEQNMHGRNKGCQAMNTTLKMRFKTNILASTTIPIDFDCFTKNQGKNKCLIVKPPYLITLLTVDCHDERFS